MATIRCSVRSCHYYGKGDYCTADEIYVKNALPNDRDDDLRAGARMEVGTMGGEDRTVAQYATKSEHTCCETFRPKDAPKL